MINRIMLLVIVLFFFASCKKELKITSLSDRSGRVGDTLIIKGSNFSIGSAVEIHFGKSNAHVPNISIPMIKSDTVMECVIPDFPSTKGTVELHFTADDQRKSLVAAEDFSILNSWKRINSETPFGDVSGLTATRVGDEFYLCAGRLLYQFNTQTERWIKKANFPGVPRYFGVAFSLNNKLFYGFGQSEFIPLIFFGDLWSYDPSTDAWEFVMNPPMGARSQSTSFVIGNKAYVGFGNNQFQSGRQSDFWEFEADSMTWNKINTPLTNLTGRITSFTIHGKGYIVGVQSSGTDDMPLAEVWEFDPVELTWSQRSDYPYWVQGLKGSASNTKGYVFSGSYGEGNKLFEYDPANDSWSQRQTSVATGRINPAIFYHEGKLYFGTGTSTMDPGTFTQDFWSLQLK